MLVYLAVCMLQTEVCHYRYFFIGRGNFVTNRCRNNVKKSLTEKLGNGHKFKTVGVKHQPASFLTWRPSDLTPWQMVIAKCVQNR